ncbi:MAG: carboxypeptidase-like regulatory domain-containing protein [archaeon]|nr:carboxypeptidase-like regulatory domain-containing protein [archaeon]
MGLRKLYYNLEDRYYNFVEKTGLYKITDRIDKVMPSFILVILLIIIIIAGILLLIFSGGKTGSDYNQVSFKVIDAESGNVLPGIPIQITTSDNTYNEITDDSGITSQVGILKDSEFIIDIDYEIGGYIKFSKAYFSFENNEVIIIALEPQLQESMVTYNFKVADQSGVQINKNGVASFTCAQGGIAPSSIEIINGLGTVVASSQCELKATITINGYNTAYDELITQGVTIYLQEKEIGFEGGEFNYTVFTKNSSGNPIENIKVIAKNDFGLIAGECVTNTGGTCVLNNLAAGNYAVNFVDNRAVPIYNTVIRNILLSDNKTDTIVMSSDISGYIKIKVVDNDNGVKIPDAYVALKNVDSLITEKYTDENGIILFTVSDLSLPYRVVVDVEGYFIKSQLVEPQTEIPTTPVLVKISEVTPNSLKPLNIRVVDDYGRGYKFAKVALFNADNGFLTDYKPKTTNFDGNVSFNITSGNYYAVAIKGSSQGQSSDFVFDVRMAETYETIIIPMVISKGNLKINVYNNNKEIIPNARVNVYDSYSAVWNSTSPATIKSDLANANGEIEFELDADNDYYVVISDPLNNMYGATQSQYVRVVPGITKNLEVTLYPITSALQKPQLVFNGLYKGQEQVNGNLKMDGEYEARYTMLVPQNRSGDDRFESVGAIIRTGSTVYLENDSLYIKSIEVPNAFSIKKYTQFDTDMSEPYEVDGIGDSETETDSDAKWAKVIFKETNYDNDESLEYLNAYEITATIKVKDIAVFGEELKMYYLGYGQTDNGIETYNPYTGTEDVVEYFDVYSVVSYGIGDEIFCTDDFCFSANIVDVTNDLRADVSDIYEAYPNKDYKLHFMLVNNQENKKYIDSRLLIENKDEGFNFTKILISQPNGNIYNVTPQAGDYEFDYAISSLASKQKVEGDIEFGTLLTGERHLVIKFVSDQQIQFVKEIIINVLSDKTFKVTVKPMVIPAGKDFSLLVNVKDNQTGLEVDDSIVNIKDRFLDNLINPREVGKLGEITVDGIPQQGANEKIYVYVTAPEYETYIQEITTTDKLFTITPKKLSYTLNVYNEKSKTESITINNISSLDLEIESMELLGEGLDIIDVDRINAQLVGYSGTTIKGLDTINDFPNNDDASKNIQITLNINPRAEGIREVQNLSGRLRISLRSELGDSPVWINEIPVNVVVGFDGMLDDSSCLTLSEYDWTAVAQEKPIEKQFTINNTCTMNERTVPLTGGLEAKVEFTSSPLGKFYLSVGSRSVELSHGYYKRVLDAFDRDTGYPVIVRYEPASRMKGEISGKIIFRSVNATSSGDQEIINEYNFTIDVLSLKDCVLFSKEVLTLYKNPDTFVIENKGCGADTTYRLSCDDCTGIVMQPRQAINVSETGSSNEISVTSYDAIPGQYQINVYSKLADGRGSERNVGKIKVIVRPIDSCLDLDRYEFDLFRSETSENTGLEVKAKSYDTANLINVCYQQEITGQAKLSNSSRLGMAFLSGLRDALMTAGGSALIQSSAISNLFKSKDKKLQEALDELDDILQKLRDNGCIDENGELKNINGCTPFINQYNEKLKRYNKLAGISTPAPSPIKMRFLYTNSPGQEVASSGSDTDNQNVINMVKDMIEQTKKLSNQMLPEVE